MGGGVPIRFFAASKELMRSCNPGGKLTSGVFGIGTSTGTMGVTTPLVLLSDLLLDTDEDVDDVDVDCVDFCLDLCVASSVGNGFVDSVLFSDVPLD